MLILIFIVALLGEHCNFDHLRLDHPSKLFCSHPFRTDLIVFAPDLAQNIDSITQVRYPSVRLDAATPDGSQDSVMEHIYSTLLAIYNKYEDKTVRGRILQCLGQSAGHLRIFTSYSYL